MAFKTFNAGDVLTSSDVNTYLAKQAVIVCTSGSRPGSAVEGMTIAETDTDRILTHDGTTWQVDAYYGDGESFTPALQGSTTNPTMGSATVLGRYWRRGSRLVDVLIWIKIGAGFAAGSGSYAVNLPVPVNATYNRWQLGMTFFDTSANAYYRGFAYAGEDPAAGVTNLNTAKLFFHAAASDFFPGITSTAPVTPASGDVYAISGSYYI